MITNQYAYNGDGQRVSIVDSQGTKKPIWDGENILLETDGSNATQAVYTLEPAGYGNLVSQRRGSTTTAFLFDALGSTRKLFNASSSSVSDSYDYRAYGETFASSGSTINVFRWVGEAGYYYDVDREAYYVRARHYSPKTARFISQDPTGFHGSPWNWYEYIRSSPLIDTDPSGLFWGAVIGQILFPWYGNYCGPQLSEAKPAPVDAMDTCCQQHDACYGGEAWYCALPGQGNPRTIPCDRRLCNCARRVNCNAKPILYRPSCFLYLGKLIRYFCNIKGQWP